MAAISIPAYFKANWLINMDSQFEAEAYKKLEKKR